MFRWKRVPSDHPLRAIRGLVEDVLAGLSREFSKLYSHTGRPSIPPEHLLKASLLQGFFTIRSERQLMEQIDYNMLFRWFVGLSMDDAVWDASTFSKNRERADAGRCGKELHGKAVEPAAGEAASVIGALFG
jgi:transposase